jgi:hypothetical protein
MDKVYADKTLELIGYKKEPFKKPENAADVKSRDFPNVNEQY